MTALVLSRGHRGQPKASKGQEVRRLQQALRGLDPDGIFGPKTDAAVRAFQADHGMAEDGQAGMGTQAALDMEIWPGTDVSGWQKTINWCAVETQEAAFCWVKTTQGITHESPNQARNLAGARAHGLATGAYHFAHPENNTAEAEAERFLTVYHAAPGDLVPALDCEASGADPSQPNATRDYYLEWLRIVGAELGCKPLVYTAKWFVRGWLNRDPGDLTNYPLWVADYKTEAPTDPDRVEGGYVYGWDEWAVWQYTNKRRIQGVPAKVDGNWMGGGWKALEGLRL